MGNLNLTALATGDAGKKATIDANHAALDDALTAEHAVDLTGGDVVLTAAQFRGAIMFVCSNVSTSGQSVTVPAVERWFMARADSGNTSPVDIVKGATSFALAPGEAFAFVSGPGANDLFKAGINGAAPMVVKPPLHYARLHRLTNFTTAVSSSTFAVDWETAAVDTDSFADLDSDASRLTIPAGSGFTRVRASGGIFFPNTPTQIAHIISILHNGVEIARRTEDDSLNDVLSMEVSSPVVEVAEGDFFQLAYRISGQEFIPVDSTYFELVVETGESANTLQHDTEFDYFAGTPGGNATMDKKLVVRPLELADDFAGSVAFCRTNPSSATAFNIDLNGSTIGTVSFATDGTPTFTTTGTAVETLAPGDRVELVAPATLNGIADISVTLKGRLI